MATILYFGSDVSLEKLKNIRQNQILFGVLQEPEYFPATFAMNRMYGLSIRSGNNYPSRYVNVQDLLGYGLTFQVCLDVLNFITRPFAGLGQMRYPLTDSDHSKFWM